MPEWVNCPRCDERTTGFPVFVEAIPSRPANLWGLIKAREATKAFWQKRCPYCHYQWGEEFVDHLKRAAGGDDGK